MLFDGYPTYLRYRTLKLTEPRMKGEDVFAFQTAAKALSVDPGPTDGILGPQTAAAIRGVQSKLSITVDGLAGGHTQGAICRFLAAAYSLPRGLLLGQLAAESGHRLGNYSPEHSHSAPGGPYYDAGVAQRNTRYTSPREAFDVPASIAKLADVLRVHYDKYEGVPTTRRRWELATGTWNAPAYAHWIARQEGATRVRVGETAQPSPTARQRLEEYMQAATATAEL